MKRTRRMSNQNTRIPFAILIILLAAVLIAVILIVVMKKDKPSDDPGSSQGGETLELGKWQEGIITYKGKKYKYNQSNNTYLFMGVDHEGPVEKAPDMISGGQSDAMFLLVANSDDKTLSIISINRNSMTDIDVCNKKGESAGSVVAQICLQHGYGDGLQLSCRRSVKVVSRLFYSLPIKGYLAMNMGGMAGMNDSIGGVELEVLQDIHYPKRGVDLKKGQVVTLNGTEAYYYLRGRDMGVFDSATDRLRRQEQYISCYMEKLKSIADGNPAKVLKIYDSISEYMVTDIDFVSMVSELSGYEYEESRMYTVPGETVQGQEYEEYYVDEEGLYDLIIKVFYEEVGED